MTDGSAIKTVWLDNPPVNAVNAGIIDTLWRELEDELGEGTRVVATGGLAQLFGRETGMIEIVDPDLTLEGLRLIYERNRNGGQGE